MSNSIQYRTDWRLPQNEGKEESVDQKQEVMATTTATKVRISLSTLHAIYRILKALGLDTNVRGWDKLN